ncbi:TetR/AcrR family transcriptional regulator [Allostreptomyces psammosilenae]|uniref:AcrR family transcriptional regulator n=1 Tax=Allostreptomyces psammosilenae TaxID=1892865 RepID=A0A852ZZ68_9ACTN|nr:TetR/AcrR family transcriptional regulator [Allostreptomyces psammosilenae]NYI07375.1 AcrR family transcriptional regulator [Allostreptomyces psammosilenae]
MYGKWCNDRCTRPGGTTITSENEPPAAPRRGLAAKREAITRAARVVFGRDGYPRASIDAIAKEAGVSTRTLYNHFGGKEELFRSAILESAQRVSAAREAVIDEHLGEVTDLEAALIAWGRAWRNQMQDAPEHFALVRQINAEAGHFPPEALEAWQEAGPRRVRRYLADRLAALAEQGLLEIARPYQAANHLMLLVAGEVLSTYPEAPTDDAEADEIVADGVHAFLHGYLPRPAP